MKESILAILIFLSFAAEAQNKNASIGIAFSNNHSAYPFSTFGKLFSKDLHPGIEFIYQYDLKTKPKHDWVHSVNAGYFYHRFVQHAIPLNTQIGYRYKFTQRLSFVAAIGIGYLHSIPATQVFELGENGEYKNGKGIGRGQGLITFSLGPAYTLNPASAKPIKLFLKYNQQVQAPFIKSYVPFLPYNSVSIGLSKFLKNNKNL